MPLLREKRKRPNPLADRLSDPEAWRQRGVHKKRGTRVTPRSMAIRGGILAALSYGPCTVSEIHARMGIAPKSAETCKILRIFERYGLVRIVSSTQGNVKATQIIWELAGGVGG